MKNAIIRVYENQTALFVNTEGLTPFALYGQRGQEIRFIAELPEIPESQSHLRGMMEEEGLSDPHYLNTMFDTPIDMALCG